MFNTQFQRGISSETASVPAKGDDSIRSLPLRQRQFPASFWQEPDVPRYPQGSQQQLTEFQPMSWTVPTANYPPPTEYSAFPLAAPAPAPAPPCTCPRCQPSSYQWTDATDPRMDPAWMWRANPPKVNAAFTAYTSVMDPVDGYPTQVASQAVLWPTAANGHQTTTTASAGTNYFPMVHYSFN